MFDYEYRFLFWDFISLQENDVTLNVQCYDRTPSVSPSNPPTLYPTTGLEGIGLTQGQIPRYISEMSSDVSCDIFQVGSAPCYPGNVEVDFVFIVESSQDASDYRWNGLVEGLRGAFTDYYLDGSPTYSLINFGTSSRALVDRGTTQDMLNSLDNLRRVTIHRAWDNFSNLRVFITQTTYKRCVCCSACVATCKSMQIVLLSKLVQIWSL